MLLMFIVFVFVNGSIVVGDKSAHEAALHLPQVNIWRCVIGRGVCFLCHMFDMVMLVSERWCGFHEGCTRRYGDRETFSVNLDASSHIRIQLIKSFNILLHDVM